MASLPTFEFDRDPNVINLLLEHVKANAVPNDPENVLATIDKFSWEKYPWMSHVGDVKAVYVKEVVKETAPMTCFEMGTYCGYSATLIASVLPPGARVITVETLERYAVIAKEIMKIAGVDDKITIVTNTVENAIPILHDDYSVETIDFVFIDHAKSSYLPDLKILETSGLLRKGAVILADNIIYPGAPEYLAYVQNSPKYKTELFHTTLEYSDDPDAVAKSVYLG